ncbi:serine protease SPPA, chloroplastic-like, partial [Olea europaea subsp. europaea]
VTLVELSRPSSSLFGLLSGLGNSIVEADTAVKELVEVMASSSGIQARMDGIVFEKLEGASYAGVVFKLIKDYLRSF